MKITPERAREILAKGQLIHSEQAIQEAVARVAGEISARLSDSNPVVLCVMAGGVIFAGQLLPRLRFPLDFDYLHASRYQQEMQGRSLAWRVAPWISLKDRSVLVIDDILDEGITLSAIRDRILQMGARECLTAVLVDKERAGEKPIKADFVALQVPDRFVFGAGMDIHGAWRNLPEIYAFGG